jgi:hypothetical protein
MSIRYRPIARTRVVGTSYVVRAKSGQPVTVKPAKAKAPKPVALPAVTMQSSKSEIQAAAIARGLSTEGTKPELLARINGS